MSETTPPQTAQPETTQPETTQPETRLTVNQPDVVAEVTAAFEAYESALVANDVDALVDWFWVSDHTVRYGIDESHHGHEAIAEYRRSQAIATPPRSLAGTVVTAFGDDVAVVDTEFHPDDSAAVGRQSQTWIRTDAGWRVASAHVSWLSGRRP